MTALLETRPIPLPDDFTIGRPVEFPVSLRNGQVAFHFVAHPDLGVLLGSIEHETPAGTHLFATTADEIGEQAGLEQGLWQIEGVRKVLDGGEGEQVILGPGDAECPPQAWIVRSVVHPDLDVAGILIVWPTVRAYTLHHPDTVFYVAQLVTLEPDSKLTRWLTWVGRERGDSVSLEVIHAPNIHVRGPVSPRPGESHLAAQRRTRLLIPFSFSFVNLSPAHNRTLNGVNWPLHHWCALRARNVVSHPNAQQQQFTAVYAADSRDPASFRALLYLATEDPSGFVKTFCHQGYQITRTEDAGPEGWYTWCPGYVPGYEDALSEADTKPRTRFGNTFVTPYPAVVGPVVARSDEFWFDVAEVYREFIAQSGMWEHKAIDNPDRGAMTHGAPLVASIEPRGQSTRLPAQVGARLYHDDFLEVTRTIRKGLDPMGTHTPVVFMHWQNLRRDGRPVWLPDYPLDDTVDPAVPATLAIAARENIFASLYASPYEVAFANPEFTKRVPPAARGYTRDGSRAPATIYLPTAWYVPAGEPDSYVLDYGSPVARRWILDEIYKPLIARFGMRAAYTDVFSGVGSQVFFDPPQPLQPAHVANGGDYYTRGKRAMVTELLDFWREFAAEQGLDRSHFFMAGEGAEEYLADKYDWVNVGYTYLGDHLMFAEDEALRWVGILTGEPEPEDAYDGVPPQSRNMSPPLWNIVHHEWAPAQRLGMPWNNRVLSTNGHYPHGHAVPTEPDYTGIPPERFVDLHTFIAGLLLTEGVRPNSFINYRNAQSPLWILDAAGNPTVDFTIDPEGTGLQIREFHARLHEALSGSLSASILFGRRERPLVVNHLAGDVELRTNPVHFVFGQDSPFDFDLEYGLAGLHVDPTSRGGPADTLTVGPYPTYSFNATTYLSGYLRYPVPTVLTAVWRVDASRLQVTIFNWSAEPARFRATLDLSLYDLPHARCRCTVRDLVGDVILQSVLPRSPIQIIAGGSDQEIAPSISIPKVPLRQVFILTIESIP